MSNYTQELSLKLYDVLSAVPAIWTLLGRHASRTLRLVSRNARNLADAACPSLHIHIYRAGQLMQTQMSGRVAGLESLAAMAERGCRPVKLTITCAAATATATAPSEATMCAILHATASSASSVSLLGSLRPSARVAAALSDAAPRLSRLKLELTDPAASRAAEQILESLGSRLTALDLVVGTRGSLPAVALEECGALAELSLGLGMKETAPLGPLKMKGTRAPPAVAAIASLTALRALDLYGDALERILDPPQRLAPLAAALSALTRLRVDLPTAFMAAPAGADADADADDDEGAGTGGERDGQLRIWHTEAADRLGGGAGWRHGPSWRAAVRRWRAVPGAASLGGGGGLVELQLGRSYDLSPYDMAVLCRAPHLAVLGCRTLTMPYPPYPPPVPTTALGLWPGLAAPPGVPLPPALRELIVRYMPAAPVLASLESLPRFEALRCSQFDHAAAVASAAARAAAAAAGAEAVAQAADTEAAAVDSAEAADAAATAGGPGAPVAGAAQPESAPGSGSGSGSCSRCDAASVASGSGSLAQQSRHSGGPGSGDPSAASAAAAVAAATARDAAAAAAAAATAVSSPAAAGRLLLLGSSWTSGAGGPSTAAHAADADPWVTQTTLAACRLLARTLELCTPTLQAYLEATTDLTPGAGNISTPADGGGGGGTAPAAPLAAPGPPPPPPRGRMPPALVVRPWEGPSGGAGVPVHPAGSWLPALAPLSRLGVCSLALRGFAFAAGELAELRGALPGLMALELRGCSAPDEDVALMWRWLRRPAAQARLAAARLAAERVAASAAPAAAPAAVHSLLWFASGPGGLRSDRHAALLESLWVEEAALLFSRL